MIRTHRPTGHHWTCASHFQQSKQYRNLDAQDWTAPFARTLVTDPDDELSDSPRVAKRRKVESFANGFLEGKPLFISSALANGPDLTTTVDKVLREKKLTWNELLDDHDDELWADGEDGWTTLRKRSKARSRVKSSRSQPNTLRKGVRHHVDERVRAIAISQPPIQTSTINPRPHISTAPSNEALLRAAELRARKASLVAKPIVPSEKLLPLQGQTTQSAPPTARAASSFKQCNSPRPFNPNTPAETTMADELRLSRTDSPSRRPRAFAVPVESFNSGTTIEGLSTQEGAEDPTATGSTAMELCTAEQNLASTNRTTSGDIPTAHARDYAPTGNVLTTWTPINDRQPQGLASGRSSHAPDMTPTAMAQSSFIPFGTSLLDPAKTPHTVSAAKATPRHTNTSTPSRKSANTSRSPMKTSQQSNQSTLTHSFKASKTEYIAADKSQSGSTPFVYRKKTKATKSKSPSPSRSESDMPQSAKSTSNGDVTPKPSDLSAHCATATPNLDLSFIHDPSTAPSTHMTLVEEHINKMLPKNDDSARRTSSVKKALRAEMRLSGADFSRAPDEPSSSQPSEHVQGSGGTNQKPSEHGTSRDSRSKRRSTGEWQGTQVLLSRAQHDLFMSPNKFDLPPTAESPKIAHNEIVDPTIFQQSHGVTSTRQPPCQPSQEFLPGTQALIDKWSPWSTTRKTKSNKRASFAPSPLAAKTPANPPTKHLLKPTVQQNPDLIERIQDTAMKQRRSSLRFSTSTYTDESPVPPQRIAATPLHVPATAATPRSATGKIDLTPSTKKQAASQPSYGPTQQDAISPEINLDFTNVSFAATAVQPPVTCFDDTTIATNWGSQVNLTSFQRGSDEPLAETVLADVESTFLDTRDFDRAMGGL
jgi:hypothetical protein